MGEGKKQIFFYQISKGSTTPQNTKNPYHLLMVPKAMITPAGSEGLL